MGEIASAADCARRGRAAAGRLPGPLGIDGAGERRARRRADNAVDDEAAGALEVRTAPSVSVPVPPMPSIAPA